MSLGGAPAPVLSQIAGRFQIDGTFISAAPFGSGHIHDTYAAVCELSGAPVRSILQRINRRIFQNPVALMENIQRVTRHISAQLADAPDRERRGLVLIPARDGKAWHVDEDGEFWRGYRFIENAHTCDTVSTIRQAYEAAKAFGHFQRLVATLPPSELHVTLPGFHNTPQRWRALEQAIAADPAGRVRQAAPEIAFAMSREPMTGILLEAGLPERVTHNDTKINNVMFDNATGEGLCVIDLDTVMPGLALYDFGDMVRTTTCEAAEDETDLSQVAMRFPMFEALLRGYLDSAGNLLTAAERELLAFSGRLITFEQGIRFLTDYLAGDTYYKIHRPDHNLDRCRTQFRLLASMESQQVQMERLAKSLTKNA